MIFILFLFFLQYALGSVIVNRMLPLFRYALLRRVLSCIVGIVFSIPILYAGDVIVKTSPYHTYGAFVIFGACVFLAYRFIRTERREANEHHDRLIDYGVLVFAFLFSSYIMTKTFKMGADGALFVGSSEVFDFGHNLSIIRSFSWGNNLPYVSPFVSGAVDIYHFFFYYWAGLLERIGMPLVFAVNIPSVLTFTLLLMMVYYFPLVVTGSRRLVGVLAVLFAISHSTLTWWFFLSKHGFSLSTITSIWRLSSYPFAAPYDDSAISIYQTLNVFVNQRHLAFPLAMCLVLYICCVLSLRSKTKLLPTAIFIGLGLGILPLWHLVITIGIAAVIGFTYVLHHRWRELVIIMLLMGIGSAIEIVPWLLSLSYGSVSADVSQLHAVAFLSKYSFLYTILVNYGIAIIVVPLGFFVLRNTARTWYVPFLTLLFGSYALSALVASEVDQKFLNIFLLLFAMLSAQGIVWLFAKGILGKIIGVACIVFYMASGIIDLAVIKNDFMYRIPNTGNNEFVSWINKYSSRDAVFLSYADIFDPVTLAGRKNYWGFFRNFGQPDRRSLLPQLYGSAGIVDDLLFARQNIHYVVFPLKTKDGFQFSSSRPLFEQRFLEIYRNSEVVVFDVRPRT